MTTQKLSPERRSGLFKNSRRKTIFSQTRFTKIGSRRNNFWSKLSLSWKTDNETRIGKECKIYTVNQAIIKIQEKEIFNHTALRTIGNILFVRYFFIRNQKRSWKVFILSIQTVCDGPENWKAKWNNIRHWALLMKMN